MDVPEVVSTTGPVAIAIDGHAVRDPDGPKGLPHVGNYFEVFPDHLGNHQRLFDQYGPIFKTTNLGRTTYHTNDPQISAIVFAESAFFSKNINAAHPLAALKTPSAGVFLGDTDTPEWKVAHKFLPPALGPKAVRHYAPTMQRTVEDAFKVFDALDEKDEAWNVYQYMLKLGSQAVGKLTLGLDFEHFTSQDAPVHEMVHAIAEVLNLNKQVTSRGDWYAKLPFGAPQRLRNLKARIEEMVDESIQKAARGGVSDLPLQDAALEASNMVGMLASTPSHDARSSTNNITSLRLCHPRHRQQRRKAPQDKSRLGPGRRNRRRIHNNKLPPLLANLRPRHIPRHARASPPRTN
jgi:hypothetical protein